ncbi:uncharacterized protein Yip1d1 isoform X2 [Palaemon carinicauda]|uniref:uncharacterized protein Yip1d1 isoform X2 n=1 Tax=Palaemon carinicauda TaxID=392227 RepID=UPI0035B58FCA
MLRVKNIKNVKIFQRCSNNHIYYSAQGKTYENFFSSSSKDPADLRRSGEEKRKSHEPDVKTGDESGNGHNQKVNEHRPPDIRLPIRRRRRYMAPGSRIVSMLPQQYWQVAGESREEIQKAVGDVQQEFGHKSLNEGKVDIDQRMVENVPLGDKLELEGNIKQEENNPVTVGISRTVHSGEVSAHLSPVMPKLRRQRTLNVSSRLSQLIDTTIDYGEKDEKVKSNEENKEK